MVKNELVCRKFEDPVILHGGMWVKVVFLKSVQMLESSGKLQIKANQADTLLKLEYPELECSCTLSF